MNKRQKMKHVKNALNHLGTNDYTRYDRHVLRTIGRNKRVLDAVNTSQMQVNINLLFKQIKEIFITLCEVITDPMKDIRKRMNEITKGNEN